MGIERTMTAEPSTAQALAASTTTTAARPSVVPLFWDTHVAPPMVVFTMMPFVPTAQAVLASMTYTPGWGEGG